MSQNGDMTRKVKARITSAVRVELAGALATAAWLNAATVVDQVQPTEEIGQLRLTLVYPVAVESAWAGSEASPEIVGAALTRGLEMARSGEGWHVGLSEQAGLRPNERVQVLVLGDLVIRRALQSSREGVPFLRPPNDNVTPIRLGGVPAWWVRRGEAAPYITTGADIPQAILNPVRLPLEIETAKAVRVRHDQKN